MPQLSEIICKYNGKSHKRGTVDCNLMVFELYDPKAYSLMYNEYQGIVDGVQHAKKVLNVRSVREYLKKNPNFQLINSNFQQKGDVVVFPKGFNCYLSLGDKWFGVCSGDKFGLRSYRDFKAEDYLVFRRIN